MKGKPCILALLAATLVSCAEPTPPPPADTTEADVAAIRAISDAFIEHFNAGDASAMAPMFMADAMELGPDTPPTVGVDAIVAGVATTLAASPAAQTATVEDVAVFGDVAYAWGTWAMSAPPPEGSVGAAQTGKWMELYKRDTDGAWKVWRWMWNAAAPGT